MINKIHPLGILRASGLIAGFLLVTLTTGLYLPESATAQFPADTDGRWTPFIGCWEPTGNDSDAGILCVVPESEGVHIFTWSEGAETTSDLLIADGNRRDAVMEGCEGYESSQFSADGRRIFTRSEFVCGGNTGRESSGIMSMISPTEWIDVHSLDSEGEHVAWVQRFRSVTPESLLEAGLADPTEGIGMAVHTGRIVASSSVSFDDIAEASEQVHAKAVEAWIAARGERFQFRGEDLVALVDRGVPESVIDVLVAVSFPDRFVIEADEAGAIEEVPVEEGGLRQGYGYPGLYGPYGFRGYFVDPYWGLYSRPWGCTPALTPTTEGDTAGLPTDAATTSRRESSSSPDLVEVE